MAAMSKSVMFKSSLLKTSVGADLHALVAAVRTSPIVARLAARLLPARDWASVRRSPDVDAYVLAWIASHVRGPRRVPHKFM
jgi:predicted NAD/FAD-dependent oxidoreductase